jgi:hypothetical protein
MNIMQYREMKEQEKAQASSTENQTPVPTTPQATPPQTTLPPATETKPPETKPEISESKLPEKIKIDGIGEVTLDELKNGYLRQSDYTQKTQEVSKQRKEVQDAVTLYEQLKQNPALVQQLNKVVSVPPTLDPAAQKVVELETRVYDMMIQQEITSLQQKYPDFEVREVLRVARDKQMNNLEDAYLLNKSMKTQSQKPEEVKQQLRQEILKELEAERSATQTIITPNGGTTPVTNNSPQLNDSEKRVAKMMKLSEADYAKWRDAGRKKK